MLIDILSLFPEYFESPFKVSILRRAIERGLINVQLTNIRDYAKGKYRKVDDRPYGGGPGMVLKPEPLSQAIREVRKPGSHVVYLSPQGNLLTPKICQRLATLEHLVLVCGHYEGVDQRVIETEIDEEISIADIVVTNGCLASLVLLDATIRFIPDVLGHEEAAELESFQKGCFEGPLYTRPEIFEGKGVPEVLKSGNHVEIEKWRHRMGVEKTATVRPELLNKEKE